MEEFSEEYLDLATLEEDTIPDDHKSGFIAVIGRPNVGKSTVLNAMLKQKVAIVTPRPQTTRVRQLGILTKPNYQMVFVDTPGIMQPRHKLDEFMLEAALESLVDADIILWLVEASEPPGAGDREIASRLREVAGESDIILAMNKNDLLAPDEVMPRVEAYRALLPETDNWILFSATEGQGVDTLLEMLEELLPQGPRYYPVEQITDTYTRDLAAELVREQILLQIRDEIPHGTAVQVQEFKERDNGVIYISATVFVEREAHKKIIIGSKGSQLREIGAEARKEIERMLGTRVYLDLWVKVARRWRRSENALKRFGYVAE